MGNEHSFRADCHTNSFQRVVARVARTGFEIRARRHLDRDALEARAEAFGRGANNRRVVIGARAQTVIDVDGDDVVALFAGEHEQRKRVGTTTATDNHTRAHDGGTCNNRNSSPLSRT